MLSDVDTCFALLSDSELKNKDRLQFFVYKGQFSAY